MRDYRRLDVYQIAYRFVLDIYQKTKDFPKTEIENITSQLRRASVSIPLNIAEGSTKPSKREFFYFLHVALASAKELEVLLNLSRDLKYFEDGDFEELSKKLYEINAKLVIFIRAIEQDIEGRKFKFFQKFKDNL